MISPLAKVTELISTGRKIDENYVYFIALLYCISTGEIGPVDLFKTAKDTKYGRYSTAFLDVTRLGIGWSYGLAASCELIAAKVSEKKEDPLKQLLVKLSQVVRLGDDLKTFFRDELKNTILTYEINYEKNLESQKLFMEMFYTLMSTSSFMIAANSIMSMMMGIGNAESMLLMSLAGSGGGMAMFVVMMYFMFPRDKLGYSDPISERKFRMKAYMAIGASIGIGTILLISNMVHPALAIGIAGIPLLYPGIIAKRMEGKLLARHEWYPSFILHLGQLYATVGSLGQALQAVLRSNFGPIHEFANGLRNRIKNRINQTIGFDLLSIECGSHIIANGNTIFSISLEKGADMNITGNIVADVTKKINELRGKRLQTASTFEMIILILHVLSLAVFGLMNKLTELFFGIINGENVSESAFTLQTIDPGLMSAMMPILVIMTSIISGVAIKVVQGGLYKTLFYHVGLLTVLGGVAMFGITTIMADFLEALVFDSIHLNNLG
jgi:flagellar protein FlaJ